jgi:hypothetical protein
VIRLDDVVAGFDANKRGRPYCVVGWVGDPPHTYALSPRTTSGPRGVEVPAGVLPGFNRFIWRAYSAPAADVEAAPIEGMLPEPYRTRVLEEVNTIEFDLED